MNTEKLSIMPAIYGQELQPWNPRKVFSRLKDQLPKQYTQRIITLSQAAELLNRHVTTVGEYYKWGLIKGTKTKQGHYRFSLQDIADLILSGRLKQYKSAEHTQWSDREISLLRNGYYLPCRTRKAAIIKRCRMKLPKITLHIYHDFSNIPLAKL